jgi:hypothetical protein
MNLIPEAVWQRLLQALRQWLSVCARVLRYLIGDVHWKAPPWSAPLGAGARRVADVVRRHPRNSALLAAAAVLLTAGSIGAWHWYKSLPKPVEFDVAVTTPERTCIECDPPGKPNPVVWTFTGSVAPLEQAGKVIDPARSGISIRPAIAGEWKWQDDRTLLFTPAQEWPLGQQYAVRFARRGFAAPQVRLARLDVEFRAPAFTAAVENNEFYQDPVVAGDKKIVTTLRFTQPVDADSLEKRVRVRLYSRINDDREEEVQPSPTYTLTYDKLRLHAYLHTSSLAVLPKGGRVTVTVDRGLQATAGGNRTTDPLQASVAVPGLYSLAVRGVQPTIARDERDVPTQALVLETTHSVTEAQMTGHIKAWLLPLRSPDPKFQQGFGDRPYPWSTSTVTDAVLQAATELKLEYVPNERDHVELHSFRFTAPPDRYVYVRVDKELKSFGGYLMAADTDRVFTVPEFPKEVHITNRGALLSLSGPKKIAVVTRDVPALRVQVGRLLPEQLQHLVTQTSGRFEQPTFHNYGFDETSVTERFIDVLPMPTTVPGAANYQALDLGKYLDKPGSGRQGIFLLRIEAWDPVAKRVIGYSGPGSTTADTRLLVVTDLGLIAKRSIDGTQDVFVQSIATGAPVAGATVQVIGRNGQPVLTASTDGDGHVRFGSLRDYREEREPVLYLARREGDSSFLPLRGQVDEQDLSRFDVGGVSNRAERAAIAAYLFSDRGIYRPGDEIRAAAIVKPQDWRPLPEGLPLRLIVTDPRGQVVKRELLRTGGAGFEELRYQTRAAGAVGTYTFSLFLIRNEQREDMIGTLEVKVQEFLPDRLRMTTHFSAEQATGWVSPDDLKAIVTLENLFGTPAANRRVRASMRLSPAAVAFAQYADYQFRDPQAAKEGFAETLAEQTTSDKGEATLDLTLSRFARATYRVTLNVQGYEADGGRGVSGEASQLVSSLPFLVGWKADGRLDFIPRGSQRGIELIAIDSRLARVAAGGLKLRRIERRFVSVLLKQDNGLYKYESRLKEVPIDERALALSAGGATIAIDTTTPGNFSYVVDDAAGQVYARIDYTIAGAANLARSMEKNAELQIALDKTDYAPGDTVRLQIQAPYTGAGLITIERDRVYAWRWFRTTTNSSVQEIQVPAGLEGNGYVSVSFVRDPSSEEIYTSPLSFGVKPFSIALDTRRNPVTVSTAGLVKPGADLAIAYRTEKPARIALFAVDEGILQVARYTTPDPLAHFFRKRSLDVSTRQILDLILPGFRASMLSAPGGDAASLLAANLNPFRRKTDAPVAWWSGIVDAGPGERTLHWTVPDYFNGRLRVMAVAVNDAAIGTAERSTLVRGDFVLSPNAPVTAAPGDEFEVSVGVANNVEGSGAEPSIDVSLTGSPQLQVLDPSRLTLKIGAMKEGSARFRVRALDAPGSGSLQFRAALGSSNAQQRVTVSVRPASAYMTTLSAGSFRGAARAELARDLYPQFRTVNASVSPLPLALAHGLVAYLDHYPYSCTEQIVSQAMPAIVLSHRPEFGELKARQGANLTSMIAELRARQTGDGGFRYWAGGVETHDFVSLYAIHVLLEAGDRGEAVPSDLLANGKEFLLRVARRDADNLPDERNAAYAIYLLARQGTVVANEASALQRRLQQRYAATWSSDIAAAYLAAAYQLMQQQSLADRTIANVSFGADTAPDRWHGAMANDGVLLYLLARHFPDRLRRLPETVLDTLVARVNGNFYDSLSAGYTVLALDAYASAAGEGAALKLGMRTFTADGRATEVQLPAGLFPKRDLPLGVRSVQFSGEGPLRGYYLVNEGGFDRKPATQSITEGLEITREFLDADGKVVTSIGLGDEVTVRIRYRAVGRPFINDAVLVDLLPGGVDVVVPNVTPSEQPFLTGSRNAGDDEEDSTRRPAGCLCTWLVTRPPGFPDFADLREDRVVIYGRATDQVQEYSYRIKATNVGSYVVPAAFGESMYDRKLRARSVAGRIVVERR